MDFTYTLASAGFFINRPRNHRFRSRVLSILAAFFGSYSIGANAGIPVEPVVTPWEYTICEEPFFNHASTWAKWCETWDLGTWKGAYSNPACANKQDPSPWYIEGKLLQKAEAHSGQSANWATNWMANGEYFSGLHCWSGSPAYSLGKEIMNFRGIDANGKGYTGRRDRTVSCPEGATAQGGQCILPEPPANQDIGGCDKEIERLKGNPCDAANGNKFESDTDISFAGIKLTRSYNSQNSLDTGFGMGWSSEIQRRLSVTSNTIISYRPDGKSEPWVKSGTSWSSDGDETLILSEDSNGLILTRSNGTAENYSPSGQLVSITDTNGLATQYHYGSNNKVTSIVGPWGHTLTLTYNNDDRVETVTDPVGNTWVYGYDTNQNLVSVTYPDSDPQDLSNNPIKTYHYENTNFPHHLTGITDERGKRFATYTYDGAGLAIGTEHATTTNDVASRSIFPELR